MLEDEAASKTVTFDVTDQPIDTVLQLLARLTESELSQVGGVSYIGTLRPEDRALLVRKVPRLSQGDIDQAVTALKSDVGRYSVTPDGLLVFSDRVEVVTRVHELVDELRMQPVDTWVVQLHVITLSTSDVRELGLDITPAIDLSALLAASSGTPTPDTSYAAIASLGAVLRAARESSTSSVIAEPLLLVRDGDTARVSSGRTDPVPLRTVSPEGTVQTERFEFIESGFSLDLSIREVQVDSAVISVLVSIDEVIGDVDGVPIRSGFELTAGGAVVSGGVYLIGSLQRDATSTSTTGIFQSSTRDTKDSTVVQVWARCYRIAGPVQRQPPAPTG